MNLLFSEIASFRFVRACEDRVAVDIVAHFAEKSEVYFIIDDAVLDVLDPVSLLRLKDSGGLVGGDDLGSPCGRGYPRHSDCSGKEDGT